ncbi:DUF2797 domain-containing protein [Candidatus Nanosalina sp. VS9-1]|uniref:DUF2797 domain-containing protein n=1 Tax=Candidatus Nanosalina sp. VS9-1 TaxID=3388566 RepID=UPI0039E137F0
MQSVVKVAWHSSSDGWKADLLLAEPGGFERWTLSPGRSFNFELSDERRCTGYAPSSGERTPCPEFRKISSGSQCSECRGKDIYSDYVRGDEQTDLDGDFSVYLAQISDNVKVGVTRSENIPKRWIEQGADYAVEILSGLQARVALENESNLSSKGLAERIRKEDKLPSAEDSRPLEKAMGQHDLDGDMVDVNELTVYEEAKGEISRKGLFQGELKSVKGQIIGNGRMALALTSGKVVKNPEQRGLNSF